MKRRTKRKEGRKGVGGRTQIQRELKGKNKRRILKWFNNILDINNPLTISEHFHIIHLRTVLWNLSSCL